MGCNSSTAFRSLKKLLISLLFALLLAGCTTTKNLSQPVVPYSLEQLTAPDISWEKISDWAWYSLFFDDTIHLKYHLVKIDLTCKKLSLNAYPSDTLQLNKGITAQKLSRSNNTKVLINTSPYSGRLWQKRKIAGIHRFMNTDFSAPVYKYSALAFEKNTDGTYSASVVNNQTQESLKSFECASGGFFTIIKDGTIQQFSYASRDSRTAAGISEDGKTLFLLVAEGENRSESAGLTYGECALIFKNLGCTQAMELDGGGSSSLFIDGKNVLSYKSPRHNAAWLWFTNCE